MGADEEKINISNDDSFITSSPPSSEMFSVAELEPWSVALTITETTINASDVTTMTILSENTTDASANNLTDRQHRTGNEDFLFFFQYGTVINN